MPPTTTPTPAAHVVPRRPGGRASEAGPQALARGLFPPRPWTLAAIGLAILTSLSDFATAVSVARETSIDVIKYGFEANEDEDFDDQPDDWTRRRGPNFPQYIKVQIDRKMGYRGGSSLRFDLNGGQATYYSPPISIDALHTYSFEGYIKAEGLQHDAAILSVSLLNHKRQRVQRFLSTPVTRTTGDWRQIKIGPITPREDIRFIVIGCHLAAGADLDIQGAVWFDDLWIGKQPRLTMNSDFVLHFRNSDAPVQINARASGLDAGELNQPHSYRMRMELRDVANRKLAETEQELEPDKRLEPDQFWADSTQPRIVPWNLPRQMPGFYRVEAILYQDGVELARQRTTFAVMRLVDKPRNRGEFGWSIAAQAESSSTEALVQAANQAGINWLKYPVWNVAHLEDKLRAGEVSRLFDRLSECNINVVGLLSDPPQVIREKFASDWQGMSEVFSLPPSFWAKSLEPAVARFSTAIRHWQLGEEGDLSFLGKPDLPAMLMRVKDEINRIGLNSEVGLSWYWDEPTSGTRVVQSFLSLSMNREMTETQLAERIQQGKHHTARWVLLKPKYLKGDTAEERGGQLVRQMTIAKVSGAEGVFVDGVYHDEHGLLTTEGAPSELFLPWRHAALAMQGAEYLGRFTMPNGTYNAAFARDGEVAMILWNDTPVEERFFFGPNPIEMDIWGRQRPLSTDPKHGDQTIQVGPVPKFVLGCSEAVTRWRQAAQFAIGRMKSEYGAHRDTIEGQNTFPQGVNGQVSIEYPPGWQAEPREWPIQIPKGGGFELPVNLTLPANASLGESMMAFDFKINADRPYRFKVYRPYQVGLGDVTVTVHDRRLPDGRLEVEQVIFNRTEPEEVLDFRCSLFVVDARRQRRQVTKLAHGEDRKFYYVPDADAHKGEEFWLRLEQDGGRRVMNYKWTVGEDWDKESTKRKP